MSAYQTISILCICIGALGIILVILDNWNDRLRQENQELREQLEKYEGKEAQKGEKYETNPV